MGDENDGDEHMPGSSSISDEDDEAEDEEDSDEPPPAGPSNSGAGRLGGGVLGALAGLGDAGLHLDEATAAAIFGGNFGSLGSIISGLSSRLKRLRAQLRSRSITKRLAALRDNEDTLGSSFSVSGFATEFIAILKGHPNIDPKSEDEDESAVPDAFDEDAQLAAILAMSSGGGMMNAEENECQLVACRCLAHLLEAMPGTGHLLVELGAVPALCSKLTNIEDIELAEQTLSTMEKISADYPAAIVREGGLGALLQFLDFFSTNVQRTAVTAAANCCRNISKDHFEQIKGVFPILRDTLTQGDQRLVEQATLAVVRTLESYRHSAENLEGLLTLDVVVAINALLMPSGGSPLLTPSTFSHLLRALTSSARRSAKVTIAFLEAGITNTLYQILTGVLPSTNEGESQGQGSEGQGLAGGVADMAVLQNLAHRPKDQVEECLALVCELLPPTPSTGVFDPKGYTERALSQIKKGRKPPQSSEKPSRRSNRRADGPFTPGSTGPSTPAVTGIPLPGSEAPQSTPTTATSVHDIVHSARMEAEAQLSQRVELLNSQPLLIGRFNRLLVPVLVDVYAASVATRVRSKVLVGLIKAISFAKEDDLLDTLKRVPMASFLCAIISSQDNPVAVLNALQLVELLAIKMPGIYQVSFQREGVVYEIEQLAATQLKNVTTEKPKAAAAESSFTVKKEPGEPSTPSPVQAPIGSSSRPIGWSMPVTDSKPILSETTMPDGFTNFTFDLNAETPRQNPTRRASGTTVDPEDANIMRARVILAKKIFDADGDSKNAASAVLEELRTLIEGLCRPGSSDGDLRDGLKVLACKLSGSGEALSSFELLKGGLVDGLLDFADIEGAVPSHDRRAMFFDVFSDTSISSPPPLAVLVKLLHESLGRLENFEVETAFNGSIDNSRPAAACSRMMKVRLQADEDSNVPKQVSLIILSIQAIAQFSALNDYLQPRIANGGSYLSGSTLSNMFAAYNSGVPVPRGAAGVGGAGSVSAAASRIISALNNASRPAGGEAGGSGGQTDDLGFPSLFSALASSAPESSRLATNPPATSAAGANRSDSSEVPPRRRSARLSGQGLGGSGTASAPAETTSGPAPALSSSAPEPTVLPTMPMSLDFDEDEDDYSDEEYAEEVYEDDLEDDMGPQPEKVVNMSVAADGSQVEAKTPEGTRIATPNPHQGAGPSGAATPRTASYAGAVKTLPSDFHLEFTLDGNKLSLNDTIYGAAHKYQRGANGVNIHGPPVVVKFRKVDGPRPEANDAIDAPSPASAISTMPGILDPSTPAFKILRLLRLIHNLTVDATLVAPRPDILDAHHFVNNKLTAKLTRQLEEVMIIASNCLPEWAVELPKHFAFLFPFETRYLFLASTAFGYHRLIGRFVSANQNHASTSSRRDDMSSFSRTPRQKLRISRSQILVSCAKVLELYGSGSPLLEFQYFDEVGTGLGPTLEFYAMTSKEFAKRSLGLWRDEDENSPGLYVKHQNGLFPAPISQDETSTQPGSRLAWFKVLGLFVGRALFDSRIIDVNLNPVFLRLILGREVKKTIKTLKLVDAPLALSLERLQSYLSARKEIEALKLPPGARRNKLATLTVGGARLADLSLDFTMPGYSDIELKPGGAHIDVDDHNLEEYLERVLDVILGSGVQRQAQAFAQGFSSIFSIADMKIFSPDELMLLFGNMEEDWSKETITHAIKADHGYNLDSRSVHNLIEAMSEFSKEERRQFLQFITGAPKLPIGGFHGLQPQFTVVRKPHEHPFRADDYLPSVMTCANYFKLPDYSSKEVLSTQLHRAMLDGGGSFHLS
ncbi:hypothetical protein BD324DRAFT_642187 [Kockovaella imperatae]|uniref:HECT-type E3 ubiquitin transferase n=1 Tax=Kockovaella imperatae TaxID=4999 RepID=A0A1Y1UGZ9_9TREE|nr:hypothetical protein BD324DRAFT_642187 [Kockovaella imperatae]ORX37302.1 hypothetical protein BD324DRAFT_642187 [Kockovaella imperatae]